MTMEPFTVHIAQVPTERHPSNFAWIALNHDAHLTGRGRIDIPILVLPRQPTPDELDLIKAVMADK